jgi:hypothetical protein
VDVTQHELFGAAEVDSIAPWADPKIPSKIYCERVRDHDHVGVGIGAVGNDAFVWVITVRADATNENLAAWRAATDAERDERWRIIRDTRRAAAKNFSESVLQR